VRKSPVGNATQAGEKDYFEEVYYLEYCSSGLASYKSFCMFLEYLLAVVNL
jgi:hypothetical protein